MVQRKTVMSGGGLPGKLSQIALNKIQKNVKCSWSREILQGERPNKGVTVMFQAILPLRGKILNVEKAMQHKVFENEEIQKYLYCT